MAKLDDKLEILDKEYISLHQLFASIDNHFEGGNDYRKIATVILEIFGETIRDVKLYYTIKGRKYRTLVENNQHLEDILKSIQEADITYLKYSNSQYDKEMFDIEKLFVKREQITELNIYISKYDNENKPFSIYGHTSEGISILADVVNHFWKDVQLENRASIPSVSDIIEYIQSNYPSCSKQLAESIQLVARPEIAKKGGAKRK